MDNIKTTNHNKKNPRPNPAFFMLAAIVGTAAGAAAWK
jgi:hypothetical protein